MVLNDIAAPERNRARAANPTRLTCIFMKMRKKSELPSKICLTCGLAFAWRKKWARDWDSVKYCSERCRRATPPTPQG
jgi:hypothetical protein